MGLSSPHWSNGSSPMTVLLTTWMYPDSRGPGIHKNRKMVSSEEYDKAEVRTVPATQ